MIDLGSLIITTLLVLIATAVVRGFALWYPPGSRLLVLRKGHKEIAFAAVILTSLLLPSCTPDKLTVEGLQVGLTMSYQGYLLEGGEPIKEEMSSRDFRELLTGRNSMGMDFLELSPRSVDREGHIIDQWGRRLRVRPVADTEAEIEIRSAGEDGIFDTRDDVHRTSGRRQ